MLFVQSSIFWPKVIASEIRDLDSSDRKFFFQVHNKLKAVGLLYNTMMLVVTLSCKQYLN